MAVQHNHRSFATHWEKETARETGKEKETGKARETGKETGKVRETGSGLQAKSTTPNLLLTLLPDTSQIGMFHLVHSPHLLAPVAPLVVVPARQGSQVAACAAWAKVSTGQGVQVTFRPPGEARPGLQQSIGKQGAGMVRH
jgi:hypothetical protein